MGHVVSQPITNDKKAPIAATWISTTRLPSRSANRPIDTDAIAPTRCIEATRNAPNWAVSHRNYFRRWLSWRQRKPGSTTTYPTTPSHGRCIRRLKRFTLRLRLKTVVKRRRLTRGWMLLGVVLNANHEKIRPTKGRQPVTMNAARYPPQVRHSPETTSENAYPTEVLAIR